MGKNESFAAIADKVIDQSGEKKAIPEMRFKQDLFVLINEMILANKRLDEGYYRRGCRYSPRDKIALMTSVIAVFKLLKNMIKDKGVSKNQAHAKIYNRIIELEYHRIEPSVDELIRMENFLLAYAHDLNLTNLLLKGGIGFEDAFGKEYG